MSEQDVRALLVSLIQPHVGELDLSAMDPSDVYLQSMGVPSADMINIIVDVEDEYEITIRTARLRTMLTFRDIIDAVVELRAENER